MSKLTDKIDALEKHLSAWEIALATVLPPSTKLSNERRLVRDILIDVRAMEASHAARSEAVVNTDTELGIGVNHAGIRQSVAQATATAKQIAALLDKESK